MEKWMDAIGDIVEKMGYTLYDIRRKGAGKSANLIIEIDHEDGISIDDCVSVSEQLSAYLDDIDPIEGSYTLEVSSAGAERRLRDTDEIRASIGKLVFVQTHEQNYRGTLESVKDGTLTLIEKNGRSHTVYLEDITLIRLAVDI